MSEGVEVKPLTLGYDSGGKRSAAWLSPSVPYTGDGKRRRRLYDRVRLEFKQAHEA